MPPAHSPGLVIVSGTSSDAHTWNLVFLQLFIEEHGWDVKNLGPCVPNDLLVTECLECSPTLVVLSTANGHGYQDGLRTIRRVRACPELQALPVVIGGALGVSTCAFEHVEGLLTAGFDSVFFDGPDSVRRFRDYLVSLPRTGRPAHAEGVVVV